MQHSEGLVVVWLDDCFPSGCILSSKCAECPKQTGIISVNYRTGRTLAGNGINSQAHFAQPIPEPVRIGCYRHHLILNGIRLPLPVFDVSAYREVYLYALQQHPEHQTISLRFLLELYLSVAGFLLES